MISFDRGRRAATQPPAAGGAAISLEKVQRTAPGIVDLYKKASVSLQKNGLAGERAAVYLVLDRSGSMRGFYQDGSVQLLAEQALGLAANLDDDGTVPVVFFDSRAYPAVDVDLTDYKGRIDREHRALGSMGSTDYAAAMRAVIDHYQASGTAAPAFVIFQTDGSPDSKRDAELTLCEASDLAMFWQFIGFGRDSFQFLRRLDDLAVPARRRVDNAGFFAAGRDPRQIPDGELYDRLTREFPSWLADARAAGIVA